MIITKIKIENFKRFKQLEIDLTSLDCLIGGNNSGKSTLLQALALFDFVVRSCISKKASNGNGNGAFEVKNRSIQPEDFVVLPVANPINLWTDRIANRSKQHILIKITLFFSNGKDAEASVDLNFNRFSVSLKTDDNQAWLSELAHFKIAYLPVFSSFLTQEVRSTPAVIEDSLSRGRVNSVVRNLLLDLKQEPLKIKQLEETLKAAFPNLLNLSVSFEELTDRFIEVSYQEEGKKKSFDLSMAGSGFQQFIYLFGFTFLKNPDVILLDEPDVFLHGALQQSLVSELRKLTTQGKQVLFATHSADLISRVEPESILYLDDGIPSRFSVQYDIYDALEKLGSHDNAQTSKINAFRCGVITENDLDWQLIGVFGRKILGEARWQKIQKRVAYLPAGGNPYTMDIAKLKGSLTNMLSLEGKPLRLFVICDLDYYPDRTKLLEEKSKSFGNDVELHIWQRNELENYLLNEDAIVRVIHLKAKTSVDENSIRAYFNKLINDSRSIIEETKQLDAFSKTTMKGYTNSQVLTATKTFIEQHWPSRSLELVDAKEFVLPEIQRWLSVNRLMQFSKIELAQAMTVAEISDDVKTLLKSLAKFAGV